MLTPMPIQNISRRHTEQTLKANPRVEGILAYIIICKGLQSTSAKYFYPRVPKVQRMRARFGLVACIGATVGCSELPHPQEKSELIRAINAQRAIACATGSHSGHDGPMLQVRDVVSDIDQWSGVTVRVSGILRVTDRGRGEGYDQVQDFNAQRSDLSLEVPATDLID